MAERLLARVREAAAQEGTPVIDLGRGNPEVGPPPHVVEALREAAGRDEAHGYPPFLGLPALKEAVAERYRAVYGVGLDPEQEVAVVPGTKTAIVELAQVLAERGSTRRAATGYSRSSAPCAARGPSTSGSSCRRA